MKKNGPNCLKAFISQWLRKKWGSEIEILLTNWYFVYEGFKERGRAPHALGTSFQFRANLLKFWAVLCRKGTYLTVTPLLTLDLLYTQNVLCFRILNQKFWEGESSFFFSFWELVVVVVIVYWIKEKVRSFLQGNLSIIKSRGELEEKNRWMKWIFKSDWLTDCWLWVTYSSRSYSSQ